MPDWATEQMQQSRIPAHLRTSDTPEPRTLSRNRRPPELLGKKLAIRLDDKIWHRCTITKYDSVRGKYQVLWDDCDKAHQHPDHLGTQWYRIDPETELVDDKWSYVETRDRKRRRRHSANVGGNVRNK